MINNTTSFDGREILVQMRKDLDEYKQSQYSKQYVIDKKEKLLEDLYDVMSTKRETVLSCILDVLEKQIADAMLCDSEIGIAKVLIPLRLHKNQTVLIDLTKTL